MSLQLMSELTLGPPYTSTKKSPTASSSIKGAIFAPPPPLPPPAFSSDFLRKAETPLSFMLCCVLMSRRRDARKLRSGTAGAWTCPLREQ
jgi:hypothetical protein